MGVFDDVEYWHAVNLPETMFQSLKVLLKIMSNITGQEDSVITQEGGGGERVLMDPRLYKAASEGDTTLLENLLNRNIEENVQQGHRVINVAPQAPQEHNNVSFLSGVTPTGDTALHIAAYFGHLEVAKRICYENKQFLNRTNDKKETPLHYAAQAGNYKLVTLFIRFAKEDGGNTIAELLRKRNQDGETALFQAIRHCQVIDAEEPRHYGKTMLISFYFLRTKTEAIKELYESEKNDHAVVAAELIRADIALANILCNHSLPPLAFITDNNGTSPLYLAIKQNSLSIATSIIGSLPEDASRAAYAGPDGQTALHAAAARSKGFTEKILRWKPELTKSTDNFGSTPLHYAASQNSEETIEMLLETDPTSAYVADTSGLCPIQMHLAVRAKSVKIFALLLGSQNINVCIVNKHGLTPQDSAFVSRRSDFLFHWQNPSLIIYKALHWIGCSSHSAYRLDLFSVEHNLLFDQKKKKEVAENYENMAKSMAIGSTLIASAAFAGACTISVAYKTDVQSGHIIPGLSLAFKAFLMMTAYAFLCSIAVTGFIVEAALNFLDDNYRLRYIIHCSRLVPEAIKGFVVAFSLGVLVIMIQVSQWRLACLVCLCCSVVPVLIQPHFWPNILVQRALIKYLGIKRFTLVGGFGFLRNIAYGIIILLVLIAGRLSNSDLAERLVLTTIVAILLFISYQVIPVNRTTWIRTKYVTMFVDHRLSLIILLTSLAYLLLFFHSS